jgi:xanthine dehydrogenase YagS FAD-binding subunit
MLPSFAYWRPASLADAVDRAAGDGAVLHAGGTDLLGCLRDGVFTADLLVSLTGLDELVGIRETPGGGLAIGAMTTITEVAEHPQIRERYAVLAQASGEVASPQLRHQGTLGGNLCQKPRCWYYRGDFPCLRKGGDVCYAVAGEHEYHCVFGGEGCFIVHPSDTAPALIALDAEVEIAGPEGRRRLPVAELHMPPAEDPTRETRLEPGEILTAVHVPAQPAARYSAYRKVRTRRSWDFAVAGTAIALDIDDGAVRDCRIVLAAAAPVPWRSEPAEEALRDRALDDQTIAAAAEAAVADAAPLPKNRYKLPLFRGVLTEELEKAREAVA